MYIMWSKCADMKARNSRDGKFRVGELGIMSINCGGYVGCGQ
jgi:hypothetical protein